MKHSEHKWQNNVTQEYTHNINEVKEQLAVRFNKNITSSAITHTGSTEPNKTIVWH